MTRENITKFFCQPGKAIRIKNDELLFDVNSFNKMRTNLAQIIILFKNDV